MLNEYSNKQIWLSDLIYDFSKLYKQIFLKAKFYTKKFIITDNNLKEPQIKMNILILFNLLIGLIVSKEIILNKDKNDIYFLKTKIGNLNMNLTPVLSLQQQSTWIKSQDCKYCTLVALQSTSQTNAKGIQKIDDKIYDCSKSCFQKAEEVYGLKCIQTHNKCRIIKDNFEVTIDPINKGVGKLVEVNIQTKQNDQVFENFQTFLIQKIIQTHPSSSSQSSDDIKKTLKQNFMTQIGKYMIWGSNSLFQTNIITKNAKKQLVVYDGLKSNNLQKEILPEISAIDIQFEQTATQFTLSQIRLSEKITLNHPQKNIQDKQIPILPLIKGFISLQTQNLLLPKNQLQKFIDSLLKTYFSGEKNKCEFKESKISCQKSISLQKVDFLQVQLILNGISIGFPLKALIKNCKSKTCDLRVSVSKNESQITLGTFFLQIFAVQFVAQTENIKLHRLNNQWNQFYSKDQKYHRDNFNIIWWMISSFLNGIFYILKIVFYLAIFSLLINFVYNWQKVLQWGIKICQKLRRKAGSNESSELFEQQEDIQAKETAKLIKRFKNRKKIFAQDQEQPLNDQITTEESSN